MTVPTPGKDVQSVLRLTEMADYIVPFTLRAICDLRVADHLAGGPRPIDELARLTGTHAPTLQRALRALAGKGVFTEVADGVFGLTPLAEPLRSDHPLSLREAYPLFAPEIVAWASFDHSLRTGESCFEAAHGKSFWQYMTEHPRDSARFDASQQAVTRRELRSALPAYDWDSFGNVVDVGGGNGAFLAGLLAQYPSLRGVVFDQPHVVSAAGRVLAEAGVADRCEVVGGSFFESVPAGGDAYLLKRVLYDWNDDRAAELLRVVRAGMHGDSRLLVIEPVIEPGNEFDWGKLYDLLLVAMGGGGARTQECLAELFAKADLELVRVVRTKRLPIVEARPT
jgi:O-methyltransferase domain